MLRIIYAGTPEFAVPALQALIDSPHQVVAVYTQPDRPAGRGRKLQPSPVKQCALDHELKLMQPPSLKSPTELEQLQSLQADLMVVAAYGLLLPQAVLDIPRLGCINIHASLLPRWRGAAPIQRALEAGDRQTGITLMQMDAGLDTGAMLATAAIDIDDNSTAASLHDELKQLGADLLMQNLPAIEQARIQFQAQDDAAACYAPKLSKQEGRIDWHKPAAVLHREIRAFNPWPVSFSYLGDQLVKVWQAGFSDSPCSEPPGQVLTHDRQGIHVCCGNGVLSISELQLAGKKRTTAAQLLNARDFSGERFASQD